MIRFCPNCRTERPLTEFYCEGTREGLTCHWDLSGVDISEPGSVAIPSSPQPPPTVPMCPNGHAVAEGDLLCPTRKAPNPTRPYMRPSASCRVITSPRSSQQADGATVLSRSPKN